VRTKGDLFDAIFPSEQAIMVKFKADLYDAIWKVARHYKPRELEIILHEAQPHVSELLNGKLGQKSLEKLLTYAGRLGIEQQGSFRQVHKDAAKREPEMAQV
jgi:predicted XRE-type DNA-binding protein